MKKIFALLSVLLITVCFTNEAKAETKQDNTIVVFEFSFEAIPTTVDNVVVYSSVENVAILIVNYKDVGGSKVINNSNDMENILYTDIGTNSKIYKLNRLNFGGERIRLTKSKHKIAYNKPMKINSPDSFKRIKANTGKSYTSFRIS